MRHEYLGEELTRSVIGAFYEVFRTLGYGHLEHTYVRALELEVRERGHDCAREVPVIVYYKRIALATQRLDMLVDGTLVVEVKAGELLHPSAKRQLVSYLKSSGFELGLLLYFGPKPQVRRAINTE